MWAKSLTH